MPGDNGDWSFYDQFLDAVFTFIKDNGMTDGLEFEIWNEPDLTNVFWQRDQGQYLDMWGRAFAQIRAALPDTPIIGPCSSSQPSSSNNWYAQYYPFVLSNNSVPDIYCWHEETNGDDVARDIDNNESLLRQLGLPSKPVNINEYGIPSEQNPVRLPGTFRVSSATMRPVCEETGLPITPFTTTLPTFWGSLVRPTTVRALLVTLLVDTGETANTMSTSITI